MAAEKFVPVHAQAVTETSALAVEATEITGNFERKNGE